jgi:hypothetical protein
MGIDRDTSIGMDQDISVTIDRDISICIYQSRYIYINWPRYIHMYPRHQYWSRFIDTYPSIITIARHRSLSWASRIQFTPPPVSLRSILIQTSLLRLGLPSGLFPSGFPTKLCTLFSPVPCVPHTLGMSINYEATSSILPSHVSS